MYYSLLIFDSWLHDSFSLGSISLPLLVNLLQGSYENLILHMFRVFHGSHIFGHPIPVHIVHCRC